MSSENIILNIDGHNYDQWKTQICRRAATYGNNAYKHGLLRLIITEEEWEIKFTGTPAPMYPKRPGDMAENATQIQIQRAKYEQDRFEAFSKIVDEFYIELIKSINEKLYQNTFGNDSYINESIPMIMEKMEVRFNEPNSESVNERMATLRNELHKDKDNNITFQEYISDIKKIRSNLSSHNEKYTDQHIMDIIQKATERDETLKEGIKNFKINNNIRSIDKFEEFIEKYYIIYKKTAEDAGYSEALAALNTKDKIAINKYPNGTYCYIHGYQSSHDGWSCRTMLKKESNFTKEHLKARSHRDKVDEKEGNNKGY
jgi:hypothetical protein